MGPAHLQSLHLLRLWSVHLGYRFLLLIQLSEVPAHQIGRQQFSPIAHVIRVRGLTDVWVERNTGTGPHLPRDTLFQNPICTAILLYVGISGMFQISCPKGSLHTGSRSGDIVLEVLTLKTPHIHTYIDAWQLRCITVMRKFRTDIATKGQGLTGFMNVMQ